MNKRQIRHLVTIQHDLGEMLEVNWNFLYPYEGISSFMEAYGTMQDDCFNYKNIDDNWYIYEYQVIHSLVKEADILLEC